MRVFDLFCGAGGSSFGASAAGIEIAGGIDSWAIAAETFALNFPQARVFNQRIDSLSATSIAREVGPIDILLASPECTNHSVAKGAAPRCEYSKRTAFDVIRFAKSWRPRWIVVENVVSMQKWEAYDKWYGRLSRLGYQLAEFKLNSEDFGVPQSRRRLFIVGDLAGPPTPPAVVKGRKKSVRSILSKRTTSNEFNYAFQPLATPRRAESTLERAGRAIKVVGPEQPFLLVYYGSDAAGGWQRLGRPLRTITTLDRFAYVRPGVHGHEMRMLQPPELAAAMGFPSSYIWPEVNRRERIKLIGNAVAPPVMEAVVRALVSNGR